MAEVLSIKAVTWMTAIVVDHLAGYFAQGVEKGLGKWSKMVHDLRISPELKGVQGVQADLRTGMNALSASISAVNQETREGTAAVLRALTDLQESQRHDEQLDYLKRAVDAIGDITSGMYGVGNPRNIDLLDEASRYAKKAARYREGNFILKIKAYRLWLATEYMHQATTRSCRDAKKTALSILARNVLADEDIISICRKYSSPRSSREQPSELLATPVTPSEEVGWTTWSGFGPVPSDVLEALKFVLDVMSSVAMLEPLDEAVSYPGVITADENGAVELGPSAPRNIIFAVGRFCASHPELANDYPTVSAIALPEWEAGKEKLAIDNFFVSMGGESWTRSGNWTDGDADLSQRFGLSLENGHVTKISLAGNNLEGVLNDDLADLEHLRELVLHGNNIYGALPPRLESLMNSKPQMVVTGVPLPDMHGPARRPSASDRSISLDNSRRAPFLGEINANSYGGTPSSTRASVGSGSSEETIKKKKSMSKKWGSFVKESLVAPFDVGYEIRCSKCGRKMKRNQEKSGLECRECASEAASQADDNAKTPW